jgi:hypothetical protein
MEKCKCTTQEIDEWHEISLKKQFCLSYEQLPVKWLKWKANEHLVVVGQVLEHFLVWNCARNCDEKRHHPPVRPIFFQDNSVLVNLWENDKSVIIQKTKLESARLELKLIGIKFYLQILV